MGGSTNTVLHLLAAAHEAGVDFTMKDIDRISRHVPCVCKVAPATAKFHMEDVHRAGGVMGILGELHRAGLIHGEVPTVHSPTMAEALAKWDVATSHDEEAHKLYKAAPGGIEPRLRSHKVCCGQSLDIDRAEAVFVIKPTHIRKTAVWRCFTAILLPMDVL
jgi:dihydroxy-acid dehydratase